MKRQIIPLIAVLFLFSGCSTLISRRIASAVESPDMKALESFAAADLKAAAADAEKHGDAAGANCWNQVALWVDSFGLGTVQPTVGIASKIERARIIRRYVEQGVPEPIHIACAPLILDARQTFRRLAVLARGLGLP